MSGGRFVREDGLTVEVITLDRGYGPRQQLLVRTASGHTHHGWIRGGVDLSTLTYQETPR